MPLPSAIKQCYTGNLLAILLNSLGLQQASLLKYQLWKLKEKKQKVLDPFQQFKF